MRWNNREQLKIPCAFSAHRGAPCISHQNIYHGKPQSPIVLFFCWQHEKECFFQEEDISEGNSLRMGPSKGGQDSRELITLGRLHGVLSIKLFPHLQNLENKCTLRSGKDEISSTWKDPRCYLGTWSSLFKNWRITALQCCVSLCRTTWLSCKYTCAPPSLPPHPTLLGHHRAPSWASRGHSSFTLSVLRQLCIHANAAFSVRLLPLPWAVVRCPSFPA